LPRSDSILAGDSAKGDIDAVDSVNRDDCQRQVCQLLLVELFSRLLVDVIRDMAVRNQRECRGPGECGTLAVRVDRRFTLSIEQVEALFTLAVGAQFLGMHVDAVGAPIDLRCSQFHQFEQ